MGDMWRATGTAALAAWLALAAGARAQPPCPVIHSFTGVDGGGYPQALTYHATPAGPAPGWALYGAALFGGVFGTGEFGSSGYGIVFRLSPPPPGDEHWQETRLYVFQGGSDGLEPGGPVVFDRSGALYGTTRRGGLNAKTTGGFGIAYKLTPPGPGHYFWDKTTLHEFDATLESAPTGLVAGPSGALFGASQTAVFELSPPVAGGTAWTYTVLHDFGQSTPLWVMDGTPLVIDGTGAIYQSATLQPASSNGVMPPGPTAAVFRLTPPAAGGSSWGFDFATVPAGVGKVTGLTLDPSGTVLEGLHATRCNTCTNLTRVLFRLTPTGGTKTWVWTDLVTLPQLSSATTFAQYYLTWINGAIYARSSDSLFKMTPPTVADQSWTGATLCESTTDTSYSSSDFGLAGDGSGNVYGAVEGGGTNGIGSVWMVSP